MAFSKLLVLFGCAAACVAAPAAGLAQSRPAAVAKPDIDPFEQAMTAHRVADFARRQNDPAAMIVAARMLMEVPMRDEGPVSAGAAPAFSAESILAEAKVMANGDPALLMQINLAQNGSRGVASSMFGAGLLRVVKDVDAKGAYSFSVKARGGEMLRVGAIGDRSASMGMRLKDAKGKVLCADVGGGSAPVCSIQPGSTGDFRVEVLNQGAASARTVILSN